MAPRASLEQKAKKKARAASARASVQRRQAKHILKVCPLEKRRRALFSAGPALLDRSPPASSTRLPWRWIYLGLAVCLGVFVVVGWWGQAQQERLVDLTREQTALAGAAEAVLRWDEALVNAARMAAETGDVAWVRRYEAALPGIDAAIATTLQIAPEELVAAFDAATADAKLVEMETQALELVQAKEAAAALAILTGDAYGRERERLIDGTQALVAGIGRGREEAIATAEGGRQILLVLHRHRDARHRARRRCYHRRLAPLVGPPRRRRDGGSRASSRSRRGARPLSVRDR